MVPRSSRDDAARPVADWLDDLVAGGASPRSAGRAEDHHAGMRAIADQLARMEAPAASPSGFDPAALRAAVAEITRRQAVLDDEPAPREAVAGRAQAQAEPAAQPSRQDVASDALAADGSSAWVPPLRGSGEVPPPPPMPVRGADPAGKPATPWTPERSGLRRAGIDLSAEVSQTFARFSRDIMDAITATDVRPEVQSLDRQVRSLGRAVDDLGESWRPHPAAAGAVSPEVAGTLAEVRGLLDSFKPGAALQAIETRIDGLAKRLERDGHDPAALIEGLSRRVDEIHQSLRSELAQSAVDTKPLERLVRDISDRIGQARASSTEFEQLQLAMQDVAARIDRVPSGGDREGVRALEGQLARIGERLDRSEASLRAIDGVEHSLGELFSQFEVTRQVAIDAAETAARTAARDTMRAALQSPGLQPRGPDLPPAFADQMARGIDDLRAMQEIAQRRTQDSLAQIQDAMERLARHMAGAEAPRAAAPASRDLRRPDGERTRVGDALRAAPAPDVDTPIEPGFGRAGAPRTEPRFEPEPPREALPAPDAAPSAPADGDGPATFIAAARRAAQAAQASAASAAALKAGERRPGAARARAAKPEANAGAGAVGRTRTFLAQRRRPLLLGLAALVMLVGALEVVNLGTAGSSTERAGMAGAVESERSKPRAADVAASTPEIATPAAATPAPAGAAAPAPLPTFVTGAAGQAPAATGIPAGLKALATSGDAAAQYEVGLRYAEGHGVARDPKEATGWLAKAAAQGLAPAEYRLGSAYEKGIGADRDPQLAMSWYGKAAEAGNIKAMHNLAVMAAEGAAGKPDYAKAAQWFQKASSYGVRDSEFNLAILYARGLGIEQNLQKSYTWFAVAASAGDEDAAKKRDEVGAKLDAAGLASAKAAAESFKPATAQTAANEVAPPAGGWNAAGPKLSDTAPAKVSRL